MRKFWQRKPKLVEVTTVYVSLLLPNHDGSGKTEVLGVYDDQSRAESRCYRELMNLGYDQPTAVAPIIFNL